MTQATQHKGAQSTLKRGITAVHCFNNTSLTPEEHRAITKGTAIIAAEDIVEAARLRVDSAEIDSKAHVASR